MIDPKQFLDVLKRNGVGFFSGVPDSLLRSICSCITENCDEASHVIAANEGNAVALAIGYHLATSDLPLVYMQNSGLGNAINPLLSLAAPEVYSIPMILLIGWRGEPQAKDEPQYKKQGKVTDRLLEAMDIPYEVLHPDMDPEKKTYVLVEKIFAISLDRRIPVALLVKAGTFNEVSQHKREKETGELSREDAIKTVVDRLEDKTLVVSTTGVASRELFEYRVEKRQLHSHDFLTVGGMGHASQIALGIALSKRDRDIVCLDGDGAFLMHMGGAAIIGHHAGPNFKHVVLNNGAHDSVGGQKTVVRGLDLIGLATACNYKWVNSVSSKRELKETLPEFININGPSLLEIKVGVGYRDDLGRPTTTPENNKISFMSDVMN